MPIDNKDREERNFLAPLRNASKLRILLSKRFEADDDDLIQDDDRDDGLMDLSKKRKWALRPNRIWWDLYDLGTRLRSINTASDYLTGTRDSSNTSAVDWSAGKLLEYVEILFSMIGTFSQLSGVGVPDGGEDVYSMGPNHVNITPDDGAELLLWDNAVLGNIDETNPTNMTQFTIEGESFFVQNCMPIWFGPEVSYQNDVVDVIAYDEASVVKLPNASSRPSADTITLMDQEALENDRWKSETTRHKEIWNPLSLEQNGTDISKRGHHNTSGQKQENIQIKVVSPLSYESFDTGDTENFKVTTGPTFDSGEVEFEATRRTPLKFFLKPQWLGFFRERQFNYSMSFSYETYRTYADTYRNNWDGPNAGTASHPPIPDSFELEIVHGNPNAPVGDGSISYSLNAIDGSYSITGLPGGASISGTGTLVVTGPGFNDQWTVIGIIGDFDYFIRWTKPTLAEEPTAVVTHSGSASYSTIWESVTGLTSDDNKLINGAGLSGRVFVGAHIGRMPAFPKILTGLWNTVNEEAIYKIGSIPFTRIYVPSGDTKDFIVEIGGGLEGWINRVVSDTIDNYLVDPYKRHEERDSKEWVAQTTNVGGKIRPDVSTTTPETIPVDGVPWQTEVDEGDMAGTFTTAVSTLNTAVSDYLDAQPHIRNVEYEYGSPVYQEAKNYFAVRLDVPAQLLCGIIQKGSVNYYIWRKTSEVRSGYDYDRGQFIGTYFTGSLE